LKKSKFSHLFSKEKAEQDHLPSANTKKAVLVFFIFFFLLYVNIQSYSGTVHQVRGFSATLFTLYQFIINQTLGIVHEGGHGVCYILPCPQFMMVAMGTLFQWLFPLVIVYYYKRQGNFMAFYTGLFILGISMDYTSWYMSTAHEGLYVPAAKSFLGVDGLHDFNYIFSTLGILPYESLISGVTKMLAYLLMMGSVIAMFFEAFPNKKDG